MYKRKNDEPRPMTISWNRMATMALALGLIVLGIATTTTVLWLITVTPTPYHSAYVYPTNPPVNTKAFAPVNSGAGMPALSMNEARFVISTADGTILSNRDGTGAQPVGVQGQDVVAAPIKQSLAYLRNGQLFVNREGYEQAVNISGQIMLPAWSADGSTLAFVVRESVGDSVYQLNVDAMQPVRLLTVPEIAAPPLSNPATGRLLIVERIAPQQTAFYTVDPQCATQSACLASRKDIATVPYTVNWADYHPSATALVFSDRDAGNLYLLSTADGKVEPLAADGAYKRRPIFSRDGKWLAYLNQNNALLVINLADKSTQITSFNGVISMDWLD